MLFRSGYPPPLPYDDNPPTLTAEDVPPLSDQEADALAAQQEENQKILAREATDVEPGGSGYSSSSAIGGTPYDDDGNLNPGWALDEENNPVYVGGGYVEPATQAQANADRTAAQVGKNAAQDQAAKRAAQNVPSQADWRVRISLAQGSNYLYTFADKDGGPGILAPLQPTNGVLFPYTPTIETTYHAKYNTTDLVHSNYRGYFYQNSYVDQVTVKGTFTAQDTREAQYLLAVIHFFRSVTKMFYGATDQYAGTPPPLVFLSGFGQYQYKNHPCLVTNFTYSLPNDVDYIRADGFNNYNINLENRRTQSAGAPPGGILSGSFSLAAKLGVNKLFAGGIPKPQLPGMVNQQVNKSKDQNSTYVPTKMEIAVTLLPTQTRKQVSQEFNVKEFANGSLLKKGFW